MLTFREGRCEKHAYWSLHDVANAGHANQLKMSFNEAAEEYERLLQASVALRMRSDVPFGSFLSGGVDLAGDGNHDAIVGSQNQYIHDWFSGRVERLDTQETSPIILVRSIMSCS